MGINKKYKRQVPNKHYFNLKYDTKSRWISYWHQIDEVIGCNPRNVLEIGVGNKTVSDYLRKIGINVTTFDFDKKLQPDIVGDIRKLPFKSNSYNVILCAEVLEHLPFGDFQSTLKELYRVTSNNVILTLPHFSITNIYVGVKFIPFISKKEFSLKVDIPLKHKFLGEHYWEIGKKGYSLQKIEKRISETGFKILKSYYPKENLKHQFFKLRK